MWQCTKMGSEQPEINSQTLKHLQGPGNSNVQSHTPTTTTSTTTFPPPFEGLSASNYVDWDMWQPPKPWSPKALTPVSKFHQPQFTYGHFYPKEDAGYYGSPQADWTPPKLPACAHSTPGDAAPRPLAAVSVNTPQGATPSTVSTPRNLSAASSGYGSNCSALFAFSPTSICLEGFDASFDLASLTPSPVKFDEDDGQVQQEPMQYGQVLSGQVQNGQIQQERRPADSDADVIYTGMTAAPSPSYHEMSPTPTPPPQPSPAPAQPQPTTVSVTSSPNPEPAPATPQPTPPASPSRVKPKEPYFSLIAKALLQCPAGRLILADIYEHLQEKFPYFLTAETSWRNVVRHNLSVNECFVKAGRAESGRGYYWAIHPSCVDMFRKGDFRRREAKKMVQLHEESSGGGRKNAQKENLVPVNQTPRPGHMAPQATPMMGGGGVVRGGYQFGTTYGGTTGYQQGYSGQYNTYSVNSNYLGQFNHTGYPLPPQGQQSQASSYHQTTQPQSNAWKRQRLA